MNEKVVAIRDCSANDWLLWLKDFADFVADKEYRKLDYHLWKSISKPVSSIRVKLIANNNNEPATIKVFNGPHTVMLDGADYSLGEFLFANFFNSEERNMAYDYATKVTSNTVNHDYSLAAISALETKADYCDGLVGTISTSTIDLAKVATINSDKTAITIDADSLTIKGSSICDSDWTYNDQTATKAITGESNSLGWVSVDLATRPTFNDVENMIDKKLKEKDKENEKMKGFNFDFGPCTGDQVRMSMYGLAVKNAAGTYVSYNPKSGEIVDVDVLNFDGAKFMYKIPVAIKEIAVGDIIVHNRKPMFVTALPTEGATAITCVDVCAGEQKQVIPTVNMFGFNFVTKIVSLFNTVGDNAPTPDAPFGNMLPFMLMNEGTDKIDPMMMMFMMGGKMDMSNPMMMYFMMKDNKDSDILPLLFMMQNK